jgi:uncharacterized membrane protein
LFRLLAGLSGVAMIAAVGWDLRHDHLLLRISPDFMLTPSEWRQLLHEVMRYVLGVAGFTFLFALQLRRRFRTRLFEAADRLLSGFMLGWINLIYFAGHFVRVDLDLAQLGWIATATASVAMYFYHYALVAQWGEARWYVGPPVATIQPVDRSMKQWTDLAVILALSYAGAFSIFSIMRHNAFGSDLFDLGMYDQMFWNTLHGRLFRTTVYQVTPAPDLLVAIDLKRYDYNFLAQQFVPLLLLLTPLYALWQDPRMLCILQSVALGAAAFALYRLAARMLASRALAFLAAFAFAMNPLVQQANLKDFHIETFEPAFLFLAIYALVSRRLWLYWPALILYLAASHSVALIVMALGIFLLVRERRVPLGLATFALGVLWYAVAVPWIMLQVRHGEPIGLLEPYRHLFPQYQGKGILGVLFAILMNPFHVFAVAFSPTRVASLLRLLLPVMAMPLLAPATALFVLPPLLWVLLSGDPAQYGLEMHYAMPILGPLYVAALCGMRNWLHAERKRRPYFVGLEPDAATHLISGIPRRHPRAYALIVGSMLAISLLFYRYGRLPAGGRFHWDDYRVVEHQKLASRYRAAVPADAGLCAQSALGAHMAERERIFLFPEIQNGVSYILIDTREHHWPFVSREAFQDRVIELLQTGRWGLAREYDDGYLVLQRNADPSSNEDVINRLNFVPYRK